MRIVTLTTDFGDRDFYVGAMKGVILGICPEALPVDISHQIPPQDVLAGAFVLRHAAGEFPPGTVHLAVIDPGVGSQRRPLALQAGGHLWVGPDNGLFSPLFAESDCRVHCIEHPDLMGNRQSATFHGRDLFAPAAAHLARGFPLDRVGAPIEDPVVLEEMHPRVGAERIEGWVIHVDHFGNLITCIGAGDLESRPERMRVGVGDGLRLDRICRTYADVEEGALLALVGSSGLLEIAVNGGSAARRLGAGRGTRVVVERL